jgi:hypothetical protein
MLGDGLQNGIFGNLPLESIGSQLLKAEALASLS